MEALCRILMPFLDGQSQYYKNNNVYSLIDGTVTKQNLMDTLSLFIFHDYAINFARL